MTGDAIDQAKWRVIAAQQMKEDIDHNLADLLDIAALVDAELLAANVALKALDPQSRPTRLSQLHAAIVETAKANGQKPAMKKAATA